MKTLTKIDKPLLDQGKMEVDINCQNQEQKRCINTNYEEIKIVIKGALWIPFI